MPLVVFDGSAVGALAVYSRGPRTPGRTATSTLLRQLADSAATELELSALSREFEAHRLRFELAIDAAEIGSFDWDLATGRLVWDDRMVELFGYDRDTFDETSSRSPRGCTPTTGTARWRRSDAAIDGCGEFDAEFRIVLPSGETRWLQGRGRVAGRRHAAPPSASWAPASTPPGSRARRRASPACWSR